MMKAFLVMPLIGKALLLVGGELRGGASHFSSHCIIIILNLQIQLCHMMLRFLYNL